MKEMETTDKNIELKNLEAMLTGQGLDEAEAHAVAVMNMELVERMKEGVVSFTFRKADGSLREAIGTLQAEVVAPHITGTGTRAENPLLTTYWDNGAENFRCFKKANLVSINA